MSEMLGNQLFMARDYLKASRQLSAVLKVEPENRKVQKKLIICYSQIGDMSLSLELFYDLIRKDPYFIIDTDLYNEDCPCPDIIERMKKDKGENGMSVEYHNVLGTLYLYCNIDESVSWFKKSIAAESDQPMVNGILKVLTQLHTAPRSS